MPHWTCEECGTRLYSASETLRWLDCPVCAGKLAPEPDDPGRIEPKGEEASPARAPRAAG